MCGYLHKGRIDSGRTLKHVQIRVPQAVIGIDARVAVYGKMAQAKLHTVTGRAGVDRLHHQGQEVQKYLHLNINNEG